MSISDCNKDIENLFFSVTARFLFVKKIPRETHSFYTLFYYIITSEKFTSNCSSNEFVVKVEIGNCDMFQYIILIFFKVSISRFLSTFILQYYHRNYTANIPATADYIIIREEIFDVRDCYCAYIKI